MKYLLKCLGTGDLIEDAYTLKYTENALLRAQFDGPMEVKPLEGVWKYLDWIPTSTSNEYVAGTTTYKAEALCKQSDNLGNHEETELLPWQSPGQTMQVLCHRQVKKKERAQNNSAS